MKILSIEGQPFHEISYKSSGPSGKIRNSSLPFFRATVDELPTGISSIVATSDLQGREISGTNRLLGEVVAEELTLLYELEEIIQQNRNKRVYQQLVWDDLEVIVDSPLASKFTEVYKALKPYWDAEARLKVKQGRHPLSFEQITTINDHQEHLATVEYLKKTARPCIVLAASGMCAGGRIVNYLKALIEDNRTDILFVGYQAAGTAGRVIQKYAGTHGYVEMDGQRYTINAGVYTLSGYSAHADQATLIKFVKRMRVKPKEIRLVHGDEEAKGILKNKLCSLYPDIRVWVP